MTLARTRRKEVPHGGASERVVEAIRAYEASGLLSEQEADGWRARFARTADAVQRPDEEVVAPEIRARALRILEDYVAGLTSEGAEQSDRLEIKRFWGMHSALSFVGAVTQAEITDISARRDAALGRSKPGRPREKAPPRPPDELLPGPRRPRGKRRRRARDRS